MVHAKGQGYALAPISYAAALRISVVPRKVLSAVSFKKWYIPISSFFNLQFIEAQVPEQYFAEDTLHAPTMQTHSRTPLPSTQSYGKQYGIVSTDQDSLFIFWRRNSIRSFRTSRNIYTQMSQYILETGASAHPPTTLSLTTLLPISARSLFSQTLFSP